MANGATVRHRRWWSVVAVAAVVLIAVAVVVLRAVVFRDQARAVSTDEAVDRFRTQASSIPVDSTAGPTTVAVIAPPTPPAVASTAPAVVSSSSVTSTTVVVSSSAAAASVALVAPGVYRYATTGQEHVDALDGTTHPYPPETTITVVAEGCGVSLRWDALQERWDQWQLCATPEGVVLGTDGIQYHEFFGQPDNEKVACAATVMLVAATPDARAPVDQQCTLADDPWLPVWTTLERTPRTVDGQQVDVQHVRMEIKDDDEYWEHTTIDWYLAPNGLPVVVDATKSSLSPSPIGAIQYDEHYQLELESLTPMR
jgi:hypothetical protein